MKTRKPGKLSKEELRAQLFARRRFHEAGNYRDDTVEKLKKRQRLEKWWMWAGAIIFMPISISLMVYLCRADDLLEPLPIWWAFPLLIAMIVPTSLGFCSTAYLIAMFVRPSPCFGRWIIVNAGIFYRYGKSPHRFVPFSSLRNLRVEKPKSLFAVIVFDTDGEPFRIARWADGSGKLPRFDFLPFLNLLIDHLRRNGWAETDLEPLLKLQRILQGRRVERHCLQYTTWLMIIVAYVTPIWVLPFYHYISTFSYPAIWWVVAFCVLITCLFFFALNSRLERWKNGKIDKILQEFYPFEISQCTRGTG